MRTRLPAVAGAFYPADPGRLRDTVTSLTPAGPAPARALAVVVPHAGYVYSGRVAGETFAAVKVPDRVVILATNHSGEGPAFAVWPSGAWRTPLGDVPVDADLTGAILERCAGSQEDESAESAEHSAEVEIPFLQHRNPAVRIAVVTVACFRIPGNLQRDRLKAFGRALGDALKSIGGDVLVAASSDMTHCGPHYGQLPPAGQTADSFAREQDAAALERLRALDADGFHRVVRDRNVTMCGWAPALAGLCSAMERGAAKADLVRYATSAEVSGDKNMVVGYAGMIFR